MRLRWILRALALPPAALMAYGLAGLGLGVWPTPDPPPAGPVRLWVAANPFHTDLVLPASGNGTDWRGLLGLPDEAEYVEIGWGDRRFYTETPQLGDLKLGTVLTALTGTDDAVMHVDWLPGQPIGLNVHAFSVTEAQAASLAAYAARALEPGPQVIPGVSYFGRDAFFRARGHWSPRFTCNEWLGAGFREAHIRTGIWTPFSDGILRHLES